MPFLTIAKNGTGLYKEKGSKFLAFAFRVKNEQEVKSFLSLLWKEHPSACHVCYAFKLGYDGKHYRAADDGEPNNSAGQPILGQINALGVTQVLVAVVRYYGGTKLGVSGLIQAYRSSAKDALEDSGTIEEDIMSTFTVFCEYSHLPVIMKEIKLRQIQIEEQLLDLKCQLQVRLKQEQSENWKEFLENQKLKFERLE